MIRFIGNNLSYDGIVFDEHNYEDVFKLVGKERISSYIKNRDDAVPAIIIYVGRHLDLIQNYYLNYVCLRKGDIIAIDNEGRIRKFGKMYFNSHFVVISEK